MVVCTHIFRGSYMVFEYFTLDFSVYYYYYYYYYYVFMDKVCIHVKALLVFHTLSMKSGW